MMKKKRTTKRSKKLIVYQNNEKKKKKRNLKRNHQKIKFNGDTNPNKRQKKLTPFEKLMSERSKTEKLRCQKQITNGEFNPHDDDNEYGLKLRTITGN